MALKIKHPMWVKYNEEFYKIDSKDVFKRESGKDIELKDNTETLTDIILHGTELSEADYLNN